MYKLLRKGEHIPCGYSMSTIWDFEKFCSSLKEHATSITTFEKKKMLPLTKEELKSYKDAKACQWKKNLKKNIKAQYIVFVI